MMEKEEGQEGAGGRDMDMRLGGHKAGTRREFLWQEPRLGMEELGGGAGIPAVSFCFWIGWMFLWWTGVRSETGDWRGRWS